MNRKLQVQNSNFLYGEKLGNILKISVTVEVDIRVHMHAYLNRLDEQTVKNKSGCHMN